MKSNLWSLLALAFLLTLPLQSYAQFDAINEDDLDEELLEEESSRPVSPFGRVLSPEEEEAEMRRKRDERKVEKEKADELARTGEVFYTIGANFRGYFVPGAVLDAWFDSYQSAENFGFALEFSRRRQNFEVAMSLGWVSFSTDDGWWWLDSDAEKNILGEADWTEISLGLVIVDVNFIWSFPLSEWFAFLVGAGFGLGFVTGSVETMDNTISLGRGCNFKEEECLPVAESRGTEDVPPILPVITVLGGGRFTIADHYIFKVEFGFRDAFFVGGYLGYQI